MDFGLYVLSLVLSLGLGFLTYQDRLFGVAGILIGFLMTAIVGNDGTIKFNSVYSVTGANAIMPYIVILIVVTILDIMILIHVNAEHKILDRDKGI